MIKFKQIFLAFACCMTLQLAAIAPANFVRPWGINFQPHRWSDQRVQLSSGFLFGAGSNKQAWDAAGNKVNDLEIWSSDQNALAMVKGYAAGTELAGIAQDCNAASGDNGIRGHFKVTGDFKIHYSYLIGARYYINDNWWLGAFLPVYKTELKEVKWTDQTNTTAPNADDSCTKTKITDNIATNVANWGDGLSLADWNRTGPGDLMLMGGWNHSFVQYKPWIKRVDPGVRLGITLPTGVKKDEDKLMFMPFGNDGSVGITIGGGLKINYLHRLDLGFDIELTHIFNNTRQRRIKVDENQTEFLLLTKTEVQKDPGFMQRFTIFAEPKLGYGVSARVAYQNVRRGSDTLYVLSNDFSSAIANSADSLKEWTTHNVIAELKWDMASEDKQKNRPQVYFFLTQPFKGLRTIQSQQFGLGGTLSF